MDNSNIKWLTSQGPTIQSSIPNKVLTMTNQILYVNGTAYLIPRRLLTDNYTIPFGINKSKWDIRASHLHDIGCCYHQAIVIDLSLHTILDKYINRLNIDNKDIYVADDIPKEYLSIKELSFNECNDLLKYGMIASDIPNNIINLYRLAVNFNLHYLFTGDIEIDLDNVSKDIMIT